MNYAEIDLSDSGKGSKPSRRYVPKQGGVEYAEIDMVATAAASRVGREHAQRREDTLWRKDRKDGSKENASSATRGLTVSGRDKRTSSSVARSNSVSTARDRKL